MQVLQKKVYREKYEILLGCVRFDIYIAGHTCEKIICPQVVTQISCVKGEKVHYANSES